ncbi:acyltransferase family protein [Roseiconus lacunae]|uniref:acyltransferase family protein n=1 Tax=Roseiconus lacunae TaxID=2605694 RepID=UPI00135CE86A|nr:acyltransferase family protein [Roseiconus lacunae]
MVSLVSSMEDAKETGERPPVNVATEIKSPDSTTVFRRHDLDALRAIAMLLGIVLHAALSFTAIPWTVQDTRQSDVYSILFAAIHGFRMPLFFLLSGFFTAMLWRKRGLRALIKHRGKRIALPLLIGCFTIIPAMWAVSGFVQRPAPFGNQNAAVWESVVAGETDQVRQAIETSELSVNAFSQDGASLLTVAVFLGHTDMVEMLLQQGADAKQRNGDQGTALHSAVFVGRSDAATLLLNAGADVEAIDANGRKPKDLLNIDFGTSNFIASSFGVPLDEDTLMEERSKIAKQLGVENEFRANQNQSGGLSRDTINALLYQLPVFMHLWFLWFLCWLVAAFAVYTTLIDRIQISKLPKWLFCSPLSLLWLVPLTMWPQSFMSQASFGPDSSIGLLPIPCVLAYYAIFFFFGAIYWDLEDETGGLGRRWGSLLSVALLVIFPIGLDLVSGVFGIFTLEHPGLKSLIGSSLQALYAWMMTFGSIGICRQLMSGENKRMRYVSDSSYWLYVAHLPLVLLAQWFVKEISIPSLFKFTGITIVVSVFLLMTYEYGVRYTIIGRMLNGPRQRPA